MEIPNAKKRQSGEKRGRGGRRMNPANEMMNSQDNKDRLERFAAQPLENKYLQMKSEREQLKMKYIKEGKMADPDAFYQIDNAVRFVAECLDMCPEYEREEREFTNFLEVFEKIPGTERVDHSKAVKRYKRSAAGDPPPLPCDVRPPHILIKTLDYLFKDIIKKHGIIESHGFVRDRCRSIRNDLTLQNYRGKEAMLLHERIARYHILCSNYLCGSDGFVMQQEVEQLRKTLQSLMEYYSENTQDLENEAEFQAYYILTFPWNNDIVSKLEQELKPNIFMDNQVQLALQIRFLMARKNDNNLPSADGSINHYSRIFTLLKQTKVSYLLACCIHLHFVDIRRGALKAMQKSYQYIDSDPTSGHQLEEIIDILGFDGVDDSTAFLSHYFIEIEDHGSLIAKIGKKVVTEFSGKRKTVPPKFPYVIIPDNIQPTKSELVELKKGNLNYLEILYGKNSNIAVGTPKDFNMHESSPKPLPITNGNGVPSTAESIGETVNWNVNANPFTPSTGIKAAGLFANSAFPAPTIKTEFKAPEFTFTKKETPIPTITVETPAKNHTLYKPNENTPLRATFKTPNTTIDTPADTPVPKFNFSTPSFSDSLFNTPSKPANLSIKETDLFSAFKPEQQATPHKVDKAVRQKELSLAEKFEAVKDVILEELLAGAIYEVANSTIIENSHKERRNYTISQEILDDIIQQEIKHSIEERHSVWVQLRGYRNAILNIVELALMDEIRYEIQSIHSNHALSLKKAKSSMRFGFDRWKYITTKRYMEKQRKIIMKEKMKRYLAQSFIKPLQTYTPKKSIENIVESKLTRFAQEMENKRATWYEPFKFESDVFPQLTQICPMKRYKIIISTGELIEKTQGTCDWFIDRWLKSKFNRQHINPLQQTEFDLLSDFSFDFESERVSILIQNYKNRGHIQPRLLHNSQSLFSGTNMAIFQLDYYSAAHGTVSNYLKTQFKLLKAFASNFPQCSQIPLLMAKQLVEGLNNLEYSPFTLCNFTCLDVSNESFDSSASSAKLIESLVWLFESASMEPMLHQDLMSEYTPIVQNFEWAIHEIQELMPKEIAQYPQPYVVTLNMMVQMYNAFIRQIMNIIIDPKLLAIPFPAKEYASIPLDWNSTEWFSDLDQLGIASLLPEFAFKTNDFQSGAGGIKSLYAHFIELLYDHPGAIAKDLDKLSESIMNQKDISGSQFFFQIATNTLQFFSDSLQLKSRNYLPFDSKKLQFNNTCQLLLQKFMDDNQFKDLVATLVTPSKKRKNREPQTQSTDSVHKAYERLRLAMLSAKQLIDK
ncbi:hypothetical protein HDV01_000665 [Terramyces sp. JEL0728]|nr:hypothetical protein HDV01_000665 [Terramyces sp. JEL0728]